MNYEWLVTGRGSKVAHACVEADVRVVLGIRIVRVNPVCVKTVDSIGRRNTSPETAGTRRCKRCLAILEKGEVTR